MAENRVQRRLAAILAADVVGYSRMVEADEAGTIARLKALQTELLEPMIAEDGGRVVKVMGDGVLIEFASAVDAVRNALAIQTEMARRNADVAEADQVVFRVGINVGDVIIDDDDIHGDGVNIAARLEGICGPGEVYVSASVHDHVDGKLPTVFDDLGEQTVKNIARPIRVFRVRPEGDESPAPPPRVAAPPQPDKTSIAVLAFDNMSGDAEQEYFSDGISEDIITDLSKLSELHVIARNSSFVYKDNAVSIPQVAQELGVRYVLEGSVRQASNRVRVTAQLIDSTSGGHVWADRYDRDLDDIFAVQDELTREIVAALKLKLTAADEDRLAHKITVDIAAYDLFLKGREQVWLHTKEGNINTRELLGRAVAIEPEYAAAYAYIAFSHIIDYANGWSDDLEQSLQIALEIAQQAVEMDDAEAQTHFALAAALLWSRQHDRALIEAERCRALEPNWAEGYIVTAHTQLYGGDPAGAIETIGAYMRLDPLFKDIVLQFLAEAHVALRQFEEAAAALQRRLQLSSNSPTAHALLASCYGHLGRIDEAQATWARLQQIDPDFSLGHRRRVLPFRNPADKELRDEGLRKAGIKS